jgi:hypothetical protein
MGRLAPQPGRWIWAHRLFLLFLTGSLLFPSANSRAGDHAPHPQVEAAIKMAYSGDLQGCERALTQLAEQGNRDPLVWWNLVVVRVRQDQLGLALHSLMQLLAQNPPENLKIRALAMKESVTARLLERARRQGDPNLFTLHDPRSLLERWLTLFPVDLWRWTAFLLFWFACVAWFIRGYGPTRLRPAASIFAFLFFLGFALAGGSDRLARQGRQITRLAVTVKPQALLKEGIVDGAPTRNLPEGVVVEVLEQVTEKLMAVRLADGREGFMDPETLRVVQ